MLKLKLQYFSHLVQRTDSFEKTLMQGKIEFRRRRGRQRLRWLDGITDSMDEFGQTGSWWWTGGPGVLQSIGSQRVGHNWATELNNLRWAWENFMALSPRALYHKDHLQSAHYMAQEPRSSSHPRLLSLHCAFRDNIQQKNCFYKCLTGLSWWPRGKEPACQCSTQGFSPWVGKIPWRRKWQPTPVFLPGKSHGQRGLGATVNGVAKNQTRVIN